MSARNEVMREQPAELRDYVAVIRAHRWSILAIVLVFTVAGFLFGITRPARYRSTARVLVLQAAGQIGQTDAGSGQGRPINLQTEAEIVDSGAVANLVRTALHSPETAERLAARVDATYTTDSQVLVIGFTAGSPAAARAGAQAFADAYLSFKTKQMNASLAQMRATLDDRLTELNGQLRDANHTIASQPASSAAARNAQAQKSLLLNQIQDVQKDTATLDTFTVHPGDVIGPATTPTKPVGSNLVYVVVGLVIGVAVGFGQAFVRDALDRRITGIGDLEAILGAPVMAVIPRRVGASPGSRDDGIVFLQQPNDPASEGYRTLRTGLLYATEGKTGQAIMVTSASEGEGKSTTAVNLAVALAQSNVAVALVDADLRRPSLHRFFGSKSAPGLIELLTGHEDLMDVLMDVGVPRLRFVPSGDVTIEAPELFAPKNLGEIVERLKAIGTMVIVDTPPLIVSDPLALAPFMDGVLFVADSTSVTVEAIAPLVERLSTVGGRVIGGVLNKYDPRRSRGYAAEYGYGTYGRGQGEAVSAPAATTPTGVFEAPPRLRDVSSAKGPGAPG